MKKILLIASLFINPLSAYSGVHQELKTAFVQTFSPEIEKIGGSLEVKFFKLIPSTWAFATKEENNYTITLFGGYFKNPNLTLDSLTLLLCHELGHILAGAPKRHDEDGNLTWSSIEGQADYFAPKCLFKFLIKNQDHTLESMTIPPNLIYACERTYGQGQSKICQRVLTASLDLIKVFKYNEINKYDPLPDFNTPDPTIVDELWEKHPNFQCRLDTYLAGLLKRTRPLCWYYPNFLFETKRYLNQ